MWLAEVDEVLTEWELRIRRFFLAASIRISSALLTATLSGLEIFLFFRLYVEVFVTQKGKGIKLSSG